MALADQDTGVVDRLGEAKLVDARLQTAFQEILNLQGQDVIELHAGLVEDTDTDETSNQGVAFEKTLGVLLVEGKELTERRSASLAHANQDVYNSLPSSTTNLGQSQTDTPDLTLVTQAILANELQLGVTILPMSVSRHNRRKQEASSCSVAGDY